MPPAKPQRSVQHEARLAQRIRIERERRGLTLERLAQRMTDAGCPMDRSAIYKIESGNPPRRITVDEFVTIAQVFEMSAAALLLPPGIATSREVTKLYRKYVELSERAAELHKQTDAIRDRMLELADAGFEDEVAAALDALTAGDGLLEHFEGGAGIMQFWQSMADTDRRIEQSRTDRGVEG